SGLAAAVASMNRSDRTADENGPRHQPLQVRSAASSRSPSEVAPVHAVIGRGDGRDPGDGPHRRGAPAAARAPERRSRSRGATASGGNAGSGRAPVNRGALIVPALAAILPPWLTAATVATARSSA